MHAILLRNVELDSFWVQVWIWVLCTTSIHKDAELKWQLMNLAKSQGCLHLLKNCAFLFTIKGRDPRLAIFKNLSDQGWLNIRIRSLTIRVIKEGGRVYK